MDDNNLVSVRFRLNGQQHTVQVPSQELLIDLIRDRLGLTGTKRSCDMEICGSCTVLVNGKAASSCFLFAFDVDGKDVLTIEGLAPEGGLHPIQEAFIQYGGFQCGFCTPGMILLAKSLLDEKQVPTEEEVREYMDANLCRCTGYQMIIESVTASAEKMRRST